jgi:hypothetical protein
MAENAIIANLSHDLSLDHWVFIVKVCLWIIYRIFALVYLILRVAGD